jgi:hypothetical protein
MARARSRSSEATVTLTIQTLVDVVGADAFDEACHRAMAATTYQDFASDVPHQLSDRLWWEGDESIRERLEVAIELYGLMPSYSNTMYWRKDAFSDADWDRMWEAYRGFLGDTRIAIADPIAYSLWVDYFEDTGTVERAWRGVAGSQEPRRPRLDRVLGASGPVPWNLKQPLYQSLANEGGWDASLIEGLYGCCIDVFGSLDRKAGLRLFRQLHRSGEHSRYAVLAEALPDPRLPSTGPERRTYLAGRAGDVG